MIAMPAVACGTNTCSSPSPPPAADLANSAHCPVMSATASRAPVLTRMISLSIAAMIIAYHPYS